MKKKITIGEHLTIEDVILVAKDPSIKVELNDTAIKKIKENRKIIEKIVEGDKAVYGVNTGFGSLSDISIEKDKLSQLQSNLVRSHSAGV
ncbi:MAG TPA: aromatic amino acid lyase, partial [bacterium]|nr:aromatic amino acid lyase [bacterium]